MTQVPNIKDTIKYIQDNNKAMEAIVKGAASTMISISEETEGVNLRKATKNMRYIASGMISYMGIVTDIIEELSRPYDNSRDLMQLLGYTEFDSDGKKLAKPQYKTIEALQQISTVMKDVVSFMFELSKQDLGFKEQKNIRRNIKTLRSTMVDLTKFIIKEFSTIMSKDTAYEIIELMMGTPGTVVKELQEIDDSTKTNSEKDNEKLRKRLEKKETEIQRGKKFGLLEVITSSLNIVSQLNNIQFAGPLEFRKKLFILRKQLTLVFKSLGQMWTEISKDKSVFNFISFMNKDDNNLFDAIMNTGMVLDVVIKHGKIKNLFSIQIAIWAYSLFSEALTKLANMVTNDRGAFAKLSDKALTKRIEAVKKNVTIISDIFKIIALMGLIAIPMLTLGLLIFPALWLMEGIIKVMVNVLNRIDSVDADKKLKELNSLIIGIIKIQAWLILMALAAAPAIIAMIIDLIFMGTLLLFVITLDRVLNIIDRVIDRRFRKSLREMLLILASLMLVQIALITLALATEASILAMIIGSIFLVSLVLFTLLIWAALTIIGKIITPKSYISFLELCAFILIIVVLEVIMVLFGKMAMEATMACLKGILFLVTLLIFVALLGVVGFVVAYLSIYIAAAIVGLLLICAMLVIFTVMVALMVVVSKLFEQLSLLKIIGSIGTLFIVIPMIISIGAMGLVAGLVAGLMVGNIMLVSQFMILVVMLSIVNKVNLNTKKILQTIDDVKLILERIKDNFGNIDFKRKAIRVLRRASTTIRIILRISRKLNRLSKITLDINNILKNVDNVFDTIHKIEEKLLIFNNTGRDQFKTRAQFRKNKRTLKRVDRITGEIIDIVNKINNIQKFEIHISDVLDRIDDCFKAVEKIEEKLAFWDGKPSSLDTRKEYRRNKRQLKRTDKVLGFVKDIVTTISEIQKLKIDESTIVSHVDKLLQTVDLIDAIIEQRIGLKDSEKNDVALSRAQKRELRRAQRQENRLKKLEAKNIDKITAIMVNVGDMISTIKDLSELKINSAEVISKSEVLLSCADAIYNQIDERFGKTTPTIDVSHFTSVVDVIKTLNESMISISDITEDKVKNTEHLFKNYVILLDKINTIKVDNVEKTTKMFKQMAQFSESIDGNFERLAETINENLMPVLEELKQIMNESSDRLEKGFNSTNETLVATSPVPVSKSGMKGIVKAGNPGMSDSQASAAADKKLAAQMRSQNQTLASKLDEVIDLLSGRGRINAMVTY